jgi:hypothetical protein
MSNTNTYTLIISTNESPQPPQRAYPTLEEARAAWEQYLAATLRQLHEGRPITIYRASISSPEGVTELFQNPESKRR